MTSGKTHACVERNKLHIAGIGPGSADLVTPAAMRVIEGCDVLIGGKRNLELFKYMGKEEVIICGKLEIVETYIRENIGKKAIVVLASGDPGIFSISEFLKNNLPDVQIEVHPGISSLQYLCAKINKSWEDAFILSLHGRKTADISAAVRKNGKVAIFTGGDFSPDKACRELACSGLKDVRVTVGENLSYADERIIAGTAEEIGKMKFDNLSVMLVENRRSSNSPHESWQFATSGIPDEMFVRGGIPMTKEEIRAVTLAKLRLKEDSVVYDIGAGTGSISVECGLMAKKGHVYAIDKEREAIELIKKNALKFGVCNITAVEGEAPRALEGLPKPDRVFIGGSGGNMESILDWIFQTGARLRIVVNAAAVETVHEALEGLKKTGFACIDISCVSVSRGRLAGSKHLMQALNPVYIIGAEKA